MPGRWESDLINCSAVETLIERTIQLAILVKLDDSTTTAAAVGLSDKLNEVPQVLQLGMTYGQGREMVKHIEIIQKTGYGDLLC